MLRTPLIESDANAERERVTLPLTVRVFAPVAEREPGADADTMLREPDGEPLARGLREMLVDVDGDLESMPLADALAETVTLALANTVADVDTDELNDAPPDAVALRDVDTDTDGDLL